jgi:hypothetical protein
MLNVFPSVVVPGVENVTLYHDDTNENLFYMVPDMPVFKTGVDGKPMLRLIVVGRDFYLFKDKSQDLTAAETELGIFNMTTALQVVQADQDRIRAYLASLRNYYRPTFQGGKVRYQVVAAHPDPSQIVLGFPEWTTPAKVTFSLAGQGAGDTFIKTATGSDAPSLLTDCTANYQATLGQEGVELMRQAITQGFSGASVWYQISFIARLPAINISISGDAKNVYSDIKKYCQVHESYSGDKSGSWSYPQVSGLDQLKQISSSLVINYDDNDFTQATGGAGDDIAKQISAFIFTTATNYIQNVFFAAPFSPGVPTAELGTDPLAHNPWKDPNAPPAAANQLWLKDFTQDMEGSFGFSATYNKNIVVTKNPSSMLEGLIGKDAYKNSIISADLSTPFFQILDASISVTADFVNDPIAAIIVHCEYKQTDEITGDVRQHSDDFEFKTGQEQFRFQSFMAKAKDGTPKQDYTYSTRLVYKYSAEPVTNPPVTTNTRELFIGYNNLSCVRVAVVLGSVPTDTVSRVQVHFEYPDPNLTIPSKSKDIFLTPDHPTDSWFTFTGNNPSTEYTYQCTYFLTNGETMTTDVQRSSSGTCAISAPFEDTLTVTFVPQGQFPPTQQIVVSTAYTDPADGYRQSDVHSFSSLRDTWAWQVRLHNRAQRAFQYKVDTTFADGSSDTGVWKDGVEGTILVGQLAQKILEVDVIPALIDFTKSWKLVLVKLKYVDEPNGVDQEQIFQISAQTASNPFVWRFPIKDQKNKQYTYEVDAYGIDPTQQKVVGPLQSDAPALVIQL